MSPMTRNEKSPSVPGGETANARAGPFASSFADTAPTIASRQVSVRSSAQEFHSPAAQFSVSKYQLMPQIGTVAATTAASGRPIWRPRLRAVRTEYCAWARRIVRRSRYATSAATAFRPQPGSASGTFRHQPRAGAPGPASAVATACCPG